MNKMNFPKINLRSGQLLLELLMAITVSAIILGLGGNLIYVSLQSNKVSGEKDTALALANETMEAVQAVAFERWQTLYSDTTHSSGATTYYPSRVSDTGRSYKWVTHTPDSTHRWRTTISINGVSALSSKNVWIVGDDPSGAGQSAVWQYRGDTESASSDATWTQRSPVNDRSFYAVETLSDTEVWAGGASGALWKWDGNSWADWSGVTRCNTGSNDIRGISASSSSNIWIVGASGKVWKVTDATTCTLIGGAGVPTGTLLGVSALDSTHIWMVGPSGKVYSYSGSAWTEHSGDTGASWSGVTFNSVSVISASNVWVAGTSGNVWSYNGSSWTSHKPADASTRWGITNSINGITAFNSTWIAIVGANGEVWENNDGTTAGWTTHYSGTSTNPACETNSLCGLSANLLGSSSRYSPEWWVVGASGNVWQFQPTRWQRTLVSAAADDDVSVSGITYNRSFYVQHVCRDDTTKNITTITDTNGSTETCTGSPSGDSLDTSTDKVTATVSWTGGETITMSKYLTRWKNVSCLQTQWASTDTGTTAYYCPSTVYKSSTTMDLTTNTQLKILLPVTNASGTLISPIFDTSGITSRGSYYNSIMWSGNTLSGSQKVQFQMAAADAASDLNTPTFYGSNGTTCNSSNWFDPGAKDTPVDLKDCAGGSANFNNKRYFRYQIRLCGSNSNSSCSGAGVGATSPTVTDVIINTSP